MTQFLLVLAVALTVGAIVFGVIALLSGDDEGLSRAEPDGRAVPLPSSRPLSEPDVADLRFDPALRGYRMRQVDAALRRISYDIGYKEELIKVLQAEIDALREGRFPDAEVLRRAREAALAHVEEPEVSPAEEPPAEEPPADQPSIEALAEDEAPAEHVADEDAAAQEPEPPELEATDQTADSTEGSAAGSTPATSPRQG